MKSIGVVRLCQSLIVNSATRSNVGVRQVLIYDAKPRTASLHSRGASLQVRFEIFTNIRYFIIQAVCSSTPYQLLLLLLLMTGQLRLFISIYLNNTILLYLTLVYCHGLFQDHVYSYNNRATYAAEEELIQNCIDDLMKAGVQAPYLDLSDGDDDW